MKKVYPHLDEVKKILTGYGLSGAVANLAEPLSKYMNLPPEDSLLEVLGDKNEFSYARENAAQALGYIKSIKSVDRLLKIVSDMADDGEVRWFSALALVNIGEASVEGLCKIIADSKGEINWTALQSIRRIAEHSNRPAKLKLINYLPALLEPSTGSTRESLAKSLANIDQKEVVPHLQHIILGDYIHSCKQEAVDMLGQLKQHEVLRSLLSSIDDIGLQSRIRGKL